MLIILSGILPFLFGCPVPFPPYSFLCSMHAVLLTYLFFFFFSLPHLLFNPYFPTFLFPASCFIYTLPGSISLFLSTTGSVLTSFVQWRREILWGNFISSVCRLWHVFTPFSLLWPFPLVLWSGGLKKQRGNSSWYPAGSSSIPHFLTTLLAPRILTLISVVSNVDI